MTDESTIDDAIEATAAAWLLEREEGLSPEREAAFVRWRDLDVRHAAVFARLEATNRLLRNLPRLRDDVRLSRRLEAMTAPRSAPARVIRFPLILSLTAAAALALGAAYLWWPKTTSFEQNYATAENDTRVILPDKSFVEMRSNSDMAVKFTPQARNVALARGEARFTVAKDASRPFVVAAGRIKVRAVGTAFRVRMADQVIEVLVTEGKVQVIRASSTANTADDEIISSLTAGERIEIPARANSAVSKVQASDAGQNTSVQSARLGFAGQTLAKVVEGFNRQNQIRLVVGDAELADRPIGDGFPDDVEAFVRGLENTGEISAERTDSATIVLRKAK